MAKSKKKPQAMKKSSKKGPSKKARLKQLQHTLKEANAQQNPLETLPSAFLTVPLLPRQLSSLSINDEVHDEKKEEKDNEAATIHHFSSSNLPPDILQQCLKLFEANMGDMYKKSNWGLNMEEKLEELQHENARFLVVLDSSINSSTIPDATTKSVGSNGDADDDTAVARSGAGNLSNDAPNNDMERSTVLGFAHYRHEPDDDSKIPITYLYELQIHPAIQKAGLGKKLTTIVELLSLKFGMKKVMLTVFHANVGAMKFYEKNKYDVDESSPSNFAGSEDCDYEIMSKFLGAPDAAATE
mmetsp:Transcript_11035/g.23942  ORF Transcript_11035/g.23942 Transcript_11035/m.23942 type:complete len:299 (-) Transcript_11035:367-1263(-)